MKEGYDERELKPTVPPEHQLASRRRLLKVLGISALAFTAGNILPNRWESPLLRFGTVPVHAQTSGEVEEPAPQGCQYTITIQAFTPGEPDRELLSGELDITMNGQENVYYRAQVSPPPPTGSLVLFYYPSGIFADITTDPGGIAQTPLVVLSDGSGQEGYGTENVYAEFGCARSATWTFSWGLP